MVPVPVGENNQSYVFRVYARPRQLACEICGLARLTGIDHDDAVAANNVTLVEPETDGVNRRRQRTLPFLLPPQSAQSQISKLSTRPNHISPAFVREALSQLRESMRPDVRCTLNLMVVAP